MICQRMNERKAVYVLQADWKEGAGVWGYLGVRTGQEGVAALTEWEFVCWMKNQRCRTWHHDRGWQTGVKQSLMRSWLFCTDRQVSCCYKSSKWNGKGDSHHSCSRIMLPFLSSLSVKRRLFLQTACVVMMGEKVTWKKLGWHQLLDKRKLCNNTS